MVGAKSPAAAISEAACCGTKVAVWSGYRVYQPAGKVEGWPGAGPPVMYLTRGA